MSNYKKQIWPNFIIYLYVIFALIFVNDGVTIYYHIADGLFLLLFIFNFLGKPKKNHDTNLYSKWILLFSIYILLSFLWAPSKETISKNLFLQFSLVINSFALFFLVRKYNAINIIIYGYITYSILNNFIYLGLVPVGLFSSQDSYLYGRFIGTNLSSNLLSIDLCFALFLSLYLIKINTNKSVRVILSVNILFSFFTLLATGSKKGLLAFLAIFLFNLYRNNSKSLEKKILFVPLMILLVFIFIQLFGTYISENFVIVDRLNSMIDVFMSPSYSDESTDQRVSFIEIGWEGFLNSPIFGHGQDAFAFYNEFYAHNNFIEILFNLGLIGFFLYYVVFFKLILLIRKSQPYFSDRITFLLLLMLFLDTALVSYNLRSYMIILTFIYLTVATQRNYEKAINTK